ncbi:hypothetical protein DFH27DRAFT_651122 [Peziza echinospora]|nr:hypothetical protein DFH27DRAFT_651122 [Peziza echinospora]
MGSLQALTPSVIPFASFSNAAPSSGAKLILEFRVDAKPTQRRKLRSDTVAAGQAVLEGIGQAADGVWRKGLSLSMRPPACTSTTFTFAGSGLDWIGFGARTDGFVSLIFAAAYSGICLVNLNPIDWSFETAPV